MNVLLTKQRASRLNCLGEVSVQVFCPFFNWVVFLPGVDSCEFFTYFGDLTLVWGIIGKYVFPHDWFPLQFDVFFSHAEAFYFDVVPFVYFYFVSLTWKGREDISDKTLLQVMSHILLPMFSSRTFMVSRLIFKSFIHLEFIFVFVVSWWSSFIFLHVVLHISNTICWRGYFYSILCFCSLYQILIDHKDLGLFLHSLFCSIDLYVCSFAYTRQFWLP